MTPCDCGYTEITGHPGDIATCSGCDWTSTGVHADHHAYHHHLATKHLWHLTMGDKRL